MKTFCTSIFCYLFLISNFILACTYDDTVSCRGDSTDIVRPDFWKRESHCRGIEPDYDLLFDDTRVHRFDIYISSEDYKLMLNNLDDLIFNNPRPLDLDAMDTPMQVPVTVEYEGQKWTHVGMRFKGRSSLVGAWQVPLRKLSFRLNFDKFEEAFPQTLNQRFFGFKKLLFGNNYNDPSFLREKIASQIFFEAGLKVARSSFAAVYVDFGEGLTYHGLYNLTEDPSDKMLKYQFGEYNGIDGNLYKPWGNAARWRNPKEKVSDALDNWWEEDIKKHFKKSTNDDSDWRDIVEVVGRLHEPINVPKQWRAQLEEVFYVHSFLDYLAVSRVIMNWDSYGCMHHNYYIYANPLDHGRFYWFPWDLGETMLKRQDRTCADLDSVLMDDLLNPEPDSIIDTNWPLITYLLSDSVYRDYYIKKVVEVLNGPFRVSHVHSLIEKYHELIAPYVVGPIEMEEYPFTTCPAPYNCNAFKDSLAEGPDALKPFVQQRHTFIKEELGL